ncbi:anoctamin-4-like [Neocloeon triangulifer]|uniref:anoctamin-4-like n=1 Tax=Neocloeon triangulifer TaxID=2078957 RepID=UPI00286F47C0|nr:anoctamin-4-like [Neocloeon triangulifer]
MTSRVSHHQHSSAKIEDGVLGKSELWRRSYGEPVSHDFQEQNDDFSGQQTSSEGTGVHERASTDDSALPGTPSSLDTPTRDLFSRPKSANRVSWRTAQWQRPHNSSGTQLWKPQVKDEDSQSLLFRDGIRPIDYVLAYEEGDTLDIAEERRREKRETFEKNLMAEGLQLELERKEDSFDRRTYFVKIHVPWRVMRRYASIMNLKMPIKRFITVSSSTWMNNGCQEEEIPKESESEIAPRQSAMRRFSAMLGLELERQEPSFYASALAKPKEEKFVVKDRELDYTSAQRSQVAWQIMMRCRYDDHDKEKVGIRRLLNNQTFLAAYPLHEGRYDKDPPEGVDRLDRRILYMNWARAGSWYKRQPLWQVRKYFGDKIGLYFAWLGFYTEMLIPAAVVGFLCFLYGCLSLNSADNIPSKEICDPKGAGNITLCPLCDKACQFQQLKDSCFFAKVTYLFDNPATVFFAIFMSFWATTFLELWKRRQAVIAWEWDLQFVDEDQEPRPEFETTVKTFRINPVTGRREPFLTFLDRSRRVVASGSVVIFMVCIVMCAVVGTILYRITAVAVLYRNGDFFMKRNAKLITSMSAAVINLIIIVLLTRFYHRLALWLTNLENPRTQTEYEDSFTFKIFVFEFMNFYSSLIYIAFFKGRFFVHPGDQHARSSEFLRLKGDVCDPAGCLSELCIQLAIIMVGKQGLNNFVELLLPKLENWWRKRSHMAKTEDREKPLKRWEEDYQLQDSGRLALFQEYLEMVLQYGFVTMFVAAFPLAPLFALLNNVAELRLDAYKMLTQARRSLAERVADIGAWYGILQGVTYTAVVSNAFVIAYTSDFIPRMVFKFGYSQSGTLEGYIQSSLSLFNTTHYLEGMGAERARNASSPPVCWYRGYRNPPGSPDQYDLSPQYWHVFAARLAFVVVFEHIVFALTGIMAYAIPDVPAEVRTQIQRERLLAKEAKFDSKRRDLNRSASEGTPTANAHPPVLPSDCTVLQHHKVIIQNSVWDLS